MMLFKVHLGWIIRIKEQQKALYLVCSLVSLVDEKIQLLIWLISKEGFKQTHTSQR